MGYYNVYAVVPIFNEAKHIKKVVTNIKKYLANIVVVDDGSKDQGGKIAKQAGAIVLSHPQNLGKAAALKTGCEYAFKRAKAKAVIFLDGDGQHDPKEIPLFLSALKKKRVDIVFGVRWFDAAMPLGKLLVNKFSSILINILFGSYIPDIPSGYKAITKRAYQLLDWNPSDNYHDGFSIETEIAAKVGLFKIKHAFVPIETVYHSKDRPMPFSAVLKIALKVIIWKITHPSKW